MTDGPVPRSDSPAPCPDGCDHPLSLHSPGLGCLFCDCTHGRPARQPAPGPDALPDWQTIREQAQRRHDELIAASVGPQAVEEALLAARGIHPVSVAHGDPESDADAKLIYEVLPDLARESGTITATRGGHDYTTYLFAGPDAPDAVAAFIARAIAVAPPRWRITPTAHPVFRVPGME